MSCVLTPPPICLLSMMFFDATTWQVRVLGMDLEKGVLDVTMDTELVKVSL